jgi:hypothetical protein
MAGLSTRWEDDAKSRVRPAGGCAQPLVLIDVHVIVIVDPDGIRRLSEPLPLLKRQVGF